MSRASSGRWASHQPKHLPHRRRPSLPQFSPCLAPYMEQLLETIIGTMEKSPSGTGQVACLVLCRIVLCGYDMPEVRSSLPRILTLYRRVLDESLFVAEQAEMGEEYDEDDQDLVSQLQYCALDMLHVFFQDQSEAALDPIARGKTDETHPFVQANFVKIVAEDEDCLQVLREIVQVLMENTKKPSKFDTSRWSDRKLKSNPDFICVSFSLFSLQSSSTMTVHFATVRFTSSRNCLLTHLCLCHSSHHNLRQWRRRKRR